MKLWSMAAGKPAAVIRWTVAVAAVLAVGVVLALATFQHDLLAAAPDYDRPEATIYAAPIPLVLLGTFLAGRCWDHMRRFTLPAAAFAGFVATFRSDIGAGRWTYAVEWALGALLGMLLAAVFRAAERLARDWEERSAARRRTREAIGGDVAVALAGAVSSWWIVYTAWAAPYSGTHLVMASAAGLPLAVAWMGARPWRFGPVLAPVVGLVLFVGARTYLRPVGRTEASIGLLLAWIAMGILVVWATQPFANLAKGTRATGDLEQAIGLGAWLVLVVVGAFAAMTYTLSGALVATGWWELVTAVPAVIAWRISPAGQAWSRRPRAATTARLRVPAPGLAARRTATLSTHEPAAFKLRAGAWMIDGAVIGFTATVAMLVARAAGLAHGFALPFVLAGLALATGQAMLEARIGQTLGGRIFGIALLVEDDRDETLEQRHGRAKGTAMAFVRPLVPALTAWTVVVPLTLIVSAMFHERGRSWLDRLLGVVVVCDEG